jgi:hypothetical protein
MRLAVSRLCPVSHSISTGSDDHGKRRGRRKIERPNCDKVGLHNHGAKGAQALMGMLKLAAKHGVGSNTVQRIARDMHVGDAP